MNETIPTVIALAIALIGGAGGIAALMKVNADNSKVVSEGAANVVKMLREQINDLDSRINVLEEYAEAMETWSDRVTKLLGAAVEAIPEVTRQPFRAESESLTSTRPRRRPLHDHG